jgi:transcriptional regulator with XRE-family HTH domain
MAEPTVLGERLLLSRRRAGLTQKELGDLVGVSSHTIARIEQGRAPQILTRSLEQLSRVLGVSADYLLGLSDDPKPIRRDTGPSAQQGEMEKPVGARYEC